MQSLAGKISIVTGAGRGIGKAVSLLLSRSGSRVVLAARSESQLDRVREEIEKERGEAMVVATDLTRDEDIAGLVNRVIEEWGPIDYLINNAGWGRHASVVKANIKDWDETLRVNLRAPMILTKLVLPGLIQKGGGAVINIASIAAKSGQAKTAAYAASKFGLLGFTQTLYEEVREYGIKVAAILPGFVDTPLIPATAKLDRNKMIRAEDVAEAVLFVLNSSATCCPVEIVIRPQRSPYL
jgi:3-oxoacyl-[acyl-carrier protein] reductase